MWRTTGILLLVVFASACCPYSKLSPDSYMPHESSLERSELNLSESHHLRVHLVGGERIEGNFSRSDQDGFVLEIAEGPSPGEMVIEWSSVESIYSRKFQWIPTAMAVYAVVGVVFVVAGANQDIYSVDD